MFGKRRGSPAGFNHSSRHDHRNRSPFDCIGAIGSISTPSSRARVANKTLPIARWVCLVKERSYLAKFSLAFAVQKRKRGGGSPAAPGGEPMHLLAAKTYTNGGEGTVIPTVFRLMGIKTAIHRTKEKISAVAEAHFASSIAEGKTGEATEIWDRHRA